MKIVLVALAFCLIGASSQSDAAEVTGKWLSIYAAGDNVELVDEGGEMRLLFRYLECSDDCNRVTFNFYVKSQGTCQQYSVVATRTFDDIYVGDYAGINVFKIEYLTNDVMAISNYHIDKQGRLSHLTKLAAKQDSVSDKERQRYESLTERNNIPKENIRNLIDTDDCPAV